MFVTNSNFSLNHKGHRSRRCCAKKLNKSKPNLRKKPLPHTKLNWRKKNVFVRKNRREPAKQLLLLKLPPKKEAKMKNLYSMFQNFLFRRWPTSSVKLATNMWEKDLSTSWRLRWWRNQQQKVKKNRLTSEHRQLLQCTRALIRLPSLSKKPNLAVNPKHPLWRVLTESAQLDQSAALRKWQSQSKPPKSLHSSQTITCKRQKWSRLVTHKANRPWSKVCSFLMQGLSKYSSRHCWRL